MIENMLGEVITYWAPNVTDIYGVMSYDAPVTIKGRWEERTEVRLNPLGEEFVSRSRVFVGQDVALKGYLAQGDMSAYASPVGVAGAHEIRDFTSVADLRYLERERKAYL